MSVDIPVLRLFAGVLVAVAGLALSVWNILIALWSWCALLVFVVVATLMTLQVRSEEKRLEADFGQEYLDYKKKVRRFL